MKAAIFDLDGTLADTLCDLADSINYGLEKLGFPIHEYEKYKLMVGNGIIKLCERALPDDKKNCTEKLHMLFNEYYGIHFLDKTSLYPDMKKTVGILAENNVCIAVATNKPQDFAKEIINRLLPDVKFLKILGGCEYRPKKPYPDIIHEILDDISFSQAFMIGDSDVDILTAKNAGIYSIGCEWGFRGRKELSDAGADFIAEKPLNIIDFILKGDLS